MPLSAEPGALLFGFSGKNGETEWPLNILAKQQVGREHWCGVHFRVTELQGHTARKWQSQELNLDSLVPEPST